MRAIYKKELRSYFTSMLGYIYIAFFLIVVGIYFMAYNLRGGIANFEYVLQALSFLFVILVPILTMRLMAEERKQKTDQLLLTSPLSVEKIIIGKYLAVLTVFFFSVAITMLYPLILKQFGEVSLKTAYAAVFGFFLLGAAYLAIGMFISTMTENQVVAAVICFVVVLVTYLMPGIASVMPGGNKSVVIIFAAAVLLIGCIIYYMTHNLTVSIAITALLEIVLAVLYFIKPSVYDGALTKVMNIASVVDSFDKFSSGIISLSSIFYYLSIAFLFVFLSIQLIKKRRWS